MKDFLFKVALVFFVFGMNTEGFGQDFEWAKSFGGTSDDEGRSISVDAFGNIYTTGYFKGTVDFDPGVGTFNLSAPATYFDIFVQKLDASGNFLWAKSFGGTSTSYDEGRSISVDVFGNVYTTGVFMGMVDFDPGAGTFNLTSAGYGDIFVQKMDGSGNFLWARSFGAFPNDDAHSINIDVLGNVYIAGHFEGTVDFDPSGGIFDLTSAGDRDVFVQKMDMSGNFLWAKSFGGPSDDYGYSISLDTMGNVYTTGYFEGTADFDPSTGMFNLTSSGMRDIFVQKMGPSGNFLWAKSFGSSSNNESGYSVSADAMGNVYTTGYFEGTADFDPGLGTTNLTAVGTNWDIFVQKMDGSGNFLWAKSFGGISYDVGHSIIVDAIGNVYTTGDFIGAVDFDPGAGTFNLTSVGSRDVFVQKMDGLGNFLWAKSFGGTSNDYGQSIAIDAIGNVYTSGYFWATVDFDPSAAMFNLTSFGNRDIFVQKLSQCISTASIDTQTTCDIYIWLDGNTYTSSNNSATYTITNTAGCDSIITLNLTIENSTSGIDNQSAPSPFTWIDGNTYTTDNNTATATVINAAGCDSVVTLNLTIIDTIIQGNITTSLSNPLQNSKVYLIEYFASQDSVFAMDSTFTDAVGFYVFPNTFQNAYVKAVPDALNYPNEMPTYNMSSAVFQNADAVYLSYPFGNTDFSTIAGINPGGNGFIGGIVGNGAGKNSEVGELLPNISLVLMNSNNEVVAQTLTDINGHFEFDNLEESLFSIWVDKAGVLNNLAPEISLAADNNQDDLKFVLHKTYLDNITSVGIENMVKTDFKIFPNPTNNIISVQNISLKEKYTVSLYSVLGEQIVSSSSNKKSMSIDLEKLELSKGTYFVKIATEKGAFVTKVVYR